MSTACFHHLLCNFRWIFRAISSKANSTHQLTSVSSTIAGGSWMSALIFWVWKWRRTHVQSLNDSPQALEDIFLYDNLMRIYNYSACTCVSIWYCLTLVVSNWTAIMITIFASSIRMFVQTITTTHSLIQWLTNIRNFNFCRNTTSYTNVLWP